MLSTGSVSLLDKLSTVLTPHQFDPVDRDPIEPPAATTNKDGVYQCKKHGSAGERHELVVEPLAETCVVRMQPLLWVEETDHKGEGCCQEGGQKVVVRKMIVISVYFEWHVIYL